MLLDRLEHVRQQPKEARKRFVFVWSIVGTGTIVLIWISVLFGQSYALRDSKETTPDNAIPTLETENVRDSFDSSNDFLGDNTPLTDYVVPDGMNSTASTSSSTDEFAPATEGVTGTEGTEDQQETPDPTEGSETPETPPLLWQ